jgi:hypothetical protein
MSGLSTTVAVRVDEQLTPETPSVHIIMYICPTPGCGNYYAAPMFRPDRTPDLEKSQTRTVEGVKSVIWPRTECPDCRQKNKHVLRVAYLVTGVVPLKSVIAQAKKNAKAAEKRAKKAAKEGGKNDDT